MLLAVGPAGADPPVTYAPPIDAPVIDPFRPPSHPYGPGNRGLEYRTRPGTPVRAAAGGVVTFAGSVAGDLHVTVRHADGVRTSYSQLASIRVMAGQRVRLGQVVGVTGARLHVGARRGDTYIDPARLWVRRRPVRVHLVPDDGGSGHAARAPPPTDRSAPPRSRYTSSSARHPPGPSHTRPDPPSVAYAPGPGLVEPKGR